MSFSSFFIESKPQYDLSKLLNLSVSVSFEELKKVLEQVLKRQEETVREVEKMKKEKKEVEKKILEMNVLIENSLGDSAGAAAAKAALEAAQREEEEKEERERKEKERKEKESNINVRENNGGENEKNEEEKNKTQGSIQSKDNENSSFFRFKMASGKKYVNDGIKLEVAVSNDEVTNKIIRKISSLENYINELAGPVYELTELKKTVDENSNKIVLHESEISSINDSLENIRKNVEINNAKLRDIDVKMQDFDIVDMLKMNAGNGEGGDSAITLGLISNLEKKVMNKFKFTDERVAKIDEDSFKMQKDVQNIKNTHELNKRTMESLKKKAEDGEKKIGELNQKIDKIMNEINNSIQNDRANLNSMLDKKVKEINDKFEKEVNDLKEKTVNLETEAQLDNKPAVDPLIDDKIKEIYKKISEIERSIKAIPHHLNIDQIKNDVAALKSAISSKSSSEELREVREKTDDLQKQINYVKELFEEFTGNQQDHEDIQSIKRRLENVSNKVHELDVNQSELILRGSQNPANKGVSVDYSRLIDVKTFEEFKAQIIKEFNSVNENFIHLRRMTDANIDSLKTKTSFKDLKSLEDDLLAKLEDLRLSSLRKFADRVDTNKNVKYLDGQIKQIVQVYIKKMDKGDSWLLAKKPINANLCASCESYLGELKNSSEYVPWNKYPMRDPNDKLYRLGNGFSKMLQMIQLDEENEKGYKPFSTSSEFMAAGKKKERKENSFPKPSSQGSGNLPPLKGNENIEFGEEDERQPKIMKVYRVNKENNLGNVSIGNSSNNNNGNK